ncbi:MAG TPA: type II toxin-antitoxin system CcdA family antitoxin [Limnobacter sp.]|nr:type II toxin-antitoxin system CcdA family antitoxin [Limnobacter sp.]
MHAAFDQQAPKKPTNVTVNSDLLAKAKSLNINLSATLEAALAELVSQRERALWKQENKKAIDAYNQLVDAQAPFSDGLRSF